MRDYSDFGIQIPPGHHQGKLKLFCPKCHERRANKRDKSLSVDLDKGVWNCHYCSWHGTIHTGERREAPKKAYRRPQPRPLTELSRPLVAWFNGRGISEATLKALKVGEGQHFIPQVNTQRNTVQFNYYLKGELVNVKYRDGAKNFTLEAGAELIPYNIDAITDQPQCIITEGEMDCLSFVEAGMPWCVSVPNGANANLDYLDDFIDGWFEDKEVIYIAVDTDKKGLLLRDELVRRFGAERCRVVTYGDDCKDANECLQRHGKEALCEHFAKAAEVKVEGVFKLADYEPQLDELYAHGPQKGLSLGIKEFDEVVSFETRRLCIITGIPSSGKSEFLDEMCVRLNINYDYKVAFFSPENMPMELHAMKITEKLVGKKMCGDYDPAGKNMTRAEYAQAKEYYADNFFHILPTDGYTIDNILAKAKYLVRKRGIRILVIDPYNRIESNQSSRETETQYISRVLDRLTNFAQQNDMLVFLMAHPRKVDPNNGNKGIPTLYDINGSANFYNKADFGIVVARHKEEPGMEHPDRGDFATIKVCKVKFRHLGLGGDVKFAFNKLNGRYMPVNKEGNTWREDNTNFIIKKLQGEVTAQPLQLAETPAPPHPNTNFLNEGFSPVTDNSPAPF